MLWHLLGERRDRAARDGGLPRADVADAAGGRTLHLGDVLRGAAGAGGRVTASARSRTERDAFPPGRAHGAPHGVAGGGGGVRDEIERLVGTPYAERTASARSSRTTSSSSRRTTRTCAACARRCPTSGSAIGTVDKFQGQQAAVVFYLDGELERGGRSARARLPLLAQPAERRDLARASAWRTSSRARGCSTRAAGRSSRCGS